MHQEKINSLANLSSNVQPTVTSCGMLFADAIDLSVHDRIESVRDEWLAAEKSADISVYQRYDWMKAYLKSQKGNAGFQPFIIVGRFEGETVFILPCHITGRLVRRLKFIGGKHVNFNLGILPRRYGPEMSARDFERIWQRIRNLVPGLGYVALCCQPQTWLGRYNPLVSTLHQRSANPAFFLDLSGGFDATLARGNAKRKRKKFRQQTRQADEMGGYRLHKPATVEEVEAAIALFVEQKARRLNELGVKDVFSEAGTKRFLAELAVSSLESREPLLQLYTLQIGSSTAAIFGGGVHAGRMSGYFSSIDADTFGHISPGEMLLYLVVEDACRQGYSQLDLGAGDERYKRSWSTGKIEMYDLFAPFNATGAPIVFARKAYGALRRRVREDERMWERYKALRRMKTHLLNPRN